MIRFMILKIWLMKGSALLMFLFLASLASMAQQKGAITGRLADSSSNQPLSLATITVFNASDTSIISYRLSDPKGAFRVPNIPHRVKARVIISFSGYRTVREEFQLDSDHPDLDLGAILMVNDPESLEEVVITAERPPVIVRKDTIEFNAASFKTLPTALVEDLLRKLPGVEVDAEGNITMNGRRVNRILVDGKSFFGDDPKMATRNLPADLIDKVQVADDKEEIDRSIDGNLSDIGKVINLRLKKGVKKGWFGKIYGGGGTDERYEVGGIGNIFRDTLQLSLLAFSNNVNRSGFSMKDVQELGGFNRSGSNSMSISIRDGNSSFSINGLSFGGGESGIMRTTGAGLNLNHAPNEKKTFFAQYFYGHSRGNLDEWSNNKQFFADTIIDIANSSHTFSRNGQHSVSAGYKLKPDSVTNLDMNASFTAAESRKDVFSSISTHHNKLGQLSEGEGDMLRRITNKQYNHRIQFTRRSRNKKGRVLDLGHSFNYGANLQHILTEQDNLFWLPAADTTLFEQLRIQDVPGVNGDLNANFTEPLTERLSVRLSQQLEYRKDQQVINTFLPSGSGKYEDLNEQLSNGFFREQRRSNTTVAFTYRIKAVNLTAGANALWQDIENVFRKTTSPVNMRLFDIMPSFNINWKRLSVHYSQNVNAPAIAYMNPVPDNTNPFMIRENNPGLKPTRQKIIRANYGYMIPKSFVNMGFYLSGFFADDDIILARNIDERGVQVNKPVNADGSRSFMSNIYLRKQFKNNTKFTFSLNTFFWINCQRQALMVNNISGFVNAFSMAPSAGFGIDWNSVLEFRPTYSLFISQTRYTNNAFENLYIPTHNVNAELVVRWPKKIVWESNTNFRNNPQVAPGMPESRFLWNAGLTYLMLKGDRGMLKLSVYDILNQNNSFSRTSVQNYIYDYRSNILQRYFLLTFTYNIRTMGAPGKIGGRERLFLF